MLLQVSYYSKEKTELINDLVGKPFGLIKRFKMKGIGSQRFLIEKANEEIMDLFAKQTGQRFTNIELRPNGIILWFRVKIDNWVLIMPYSQLALIKTSIKIQLTSGPWNVELKPAHNASLNNKFIIKLLEQKASILKDQFN